MSTTSQSLNPARADREKLQAMMGRYGETLTQGLNCALSLLGSELGLYSALAELGPANSSALAQRLGLHERWVREWLRQQACMGQIDYDEAQDNFSLSPEARLLFADPHSPFGAHGGLDVQGRPREPEDEHHARDDGRDGGNDRQ